MWSSRFLKESRSCFNLLDLEAASLLRTGTYLDPRELESKALLCARKGIIDVVSIRLVSPRVIMLWLLGLLVQCVRSTVMLQT